jgi:hypothetical protein
MFKVISVNNDGNYYDSGPTDNNALPAGNDYPLHNHVMLANIVEAVSLILKNVCENTSYEIISDSELGAAAIKSLIAARLTQLINRKITEA